MNPRSPRSPSAPGTAPHGLRSSILALLILVLASCTPNLTAEFEASGGEDVTAESSGGFVIVRIPDERPRDGIEVRRDGRDDVHVPPGHYPPPGECRIWHPNRPPGQQPPPGSCSTLEQQVPEDAILIYG